MSEKEIVINHAAIAQRVNELGTRITHDYTDTHLLVVGVLNGAFIFMADLVREIKLNLQIDFVRVASYGMSTKSSREIRFVKDVELDIKGRDILIVEDIVDTGLTLASLKDHFQKGGAKSVRTCALIDKKERRENEVAIEYVGFTVEEGFLVGYGLDCKEQYRNLEGVFHLFKP